MKSGRLLVYLTVCIVISQVFVACTTSGGSAPFTAIPDLSGATYVVGPYVSSPSRTPYPPPTRRAPDATDIPSATPQPSLTPLPPLFKYVFPIQPSNAATYGEGVKAHGYPATDLFAQKGTKFVAVVDGVVEFVSNVDRWDSQQNDPALRSGLAVAIIGDDKVRYYGAHLSAIAPGIYPGLRVTAGQLLGYVGDSGDAAGKTPHLHFGISRPTYSDDWKARRGEVDPFPYLNAWKQDLNWTPILP